MKAKVEELVRRADDKQRAVADLTRKVSVDLRQSAGGGTMPLRESLQSEVRSEFSEQSRESELAKDENILDFKIEDADFLAEAIASVPSV